MNQEPSSQENKENVFHGGQEYKDFTMKDFNKTIPQDVRHGPVSDLA